MAQAKKKRAKKTGKQGSSYGGRKSANEVAAPPEAEKTPLSRREVRPYVYAGLCSSLAFVYFILFTWGLPNRHVRVSVLLYSFVVAIAVMAGAMLVRRRRSWWIAMCAGGYMLVAWVAILVMILMTAGFLSGVYGAFGKAAGMFALMTAVLSFQLLALLPVLQMKFLMTRAGRRWFGLEPLWS